jgi:hypothetical protein
MEYLVFLAFYIAPYKEVSSEVRDLGGPRNGSSSSYPSLLQLRRHFAFRAIGAPLVSDILKIRVDKEN